MICSWIENKLAERRLDVTVKNVTDSISVLGVAGPKSRDLLQSLTDTNLSEDFDFLQCKKLNIADVTVTAVRISYTGNKKSTKKLLCSLRFNVLSRK